MPLRISRRTQLAFAEFATARSTINQISRAFESEDFAANPARPDLGVCASFHAGIDPRSATQQRRLLAVYLTAIDDWGYDPDGSLASTAVALIRSLGRDGWPVDHTGTLTGPLPTAELELAELPRFGDPGILDEYLDRMRANIDRDTPAVIGAAKELVEAVCKRILDDSGVAYAAGAPLTALYKAVAQELRLSRDSVPANATGGEAAQRVLQGLVTTVQNLAELRNAIGAGHGRPGRVPALERHARLAMNASYTIVDFLLSTWHARPDAHAA